MRRPLIEPLSLTSATAELAWRDLELADPLRDELRRLSERLRRRMTARPPRAYRRNTLSSAQLLFCAGASAEKLLVAHLIARGLDRRVLTVSVPALRGRYIGETEKNLDQVFDLADRGGWVLFFDEADALFGKRTSLQASYSRYANQEVSYLLQRAADYRGVVILSTRRRPGMNAAARRSLQAVIGFD